MKGTMKTKIKVKKVKLIPSYKLKELLTCTDTERLRWVKLGYLIPTEFRGISKYGKTLKVPYFDPAYLLTVTKEVIEEWRTKDKGQASINRITGSIIAKQTRKVNSGIIKEFKLRYNELLKLWEKDGERYSSTYRLAYWTVWISRWAKRYQMVDRITSFQKKANFYELKNKAMDLLYKSGLGSLSFYAPEYPDKVHVHMCEEHWYGIESIDEDVAKNCRNCSYSVSKNYYSLYYQEFFDIYSGISFSFHIPFPLGSGFLPPHKLLPKVEHIEEGEGLFRFGRPIADEEKIIYSNTRVLTEFNSAFEDLKRVL